MNIYHLVTRQQKLCLLFRTTCSKVLRTKLVEFLIYAKEKQLLCNFPLGDLFSQPSPHPNTAPASAWFYWAGKITLQFIELKPLIIKISILKLSLKPVTSPWESVPDDKRGNLLFSHSWFPSFLFSPLTYFVPSFLLLFLFFSFLFPWKKLYYNRLGRIVQRLVGSDYAGDVLGENLGTKNQVLFKETLRELCWVWDPHQSLATWSCCHVLMSVGVFIMRWLIMHACERNR